MNDSTPPLSDAQRDALIRTLTRQVSEAEDVIRELRAELVAAEQENARLKAGLLPEVPFVA